ncbi:hypothetical protein BDZ89DRAFT_1113122 [Hymenopellis radicata]|nr:hypothetical protein BDZ89DRAFT_1113122 [Hymenopellis radicata]
MPKIVMSRSRYQFHASSASSSSSSGVRVNDIAVREAGCLLVGFPAAVGVVGDDGCFVAAAVGEVVGDERLDVLDVGDDVMGESVSVDVDVVGEWDVLSLEVRSDPVLPKELRPDEPVRDSDGFKGAAGVVGGVTAAGLDGLEEEMSSTAEIGLGGWTGTEVGGVATTEAAGVGGGAATGAGDAGKSGVDGVLDACCRSNPRETMRSHLRFSSRSSASCTAS